ncbi:MAG TPA: response regulator transcription factor [Actinomycetota bacterium]|nr:response regulator transcription factor [Actinomycetota bacterium]
MRILVIEDDPALALPLRKSLEREGYEVRLCDEGGQGVDVARTWHPSVVLLDVELPDGNGREVAQRIRTFSPVPIIMVTGRGQTQDKIRGLDAGANDYVVKPFDIDELLARIRAATRPAVASATAADPTASTVALADLRLDMPARRAYRGEEDLGLTVKEFEILRVFAFRPGEIIRRDEISRAVWGTSPSEGGNTIDVHMSWLRKKLGDDPASPRYIETVRGRGFRFRAPAS